jgi:small-conductance mechanosensitive channel
MIIDLGAIVAGCLIGVVVLSGEADAFSTPTQLGQRLYVPQNTKPLPHTKTRTFSTDLHLALKGNAAAHTTFLAGKVWPALRKFIIGPAKAREIVTNVLRITYWQDVAALLFLAYGSEWIARFVYPYLPERYRPTEEYEERDFGITAFLSEISRVSLSCYAVDILSATLSTIGFEFVQKWQVASTYSKMALTSWAIKKSLQFKTVVLCKAFKIDEIEAGGRIEVLDRLLNAVIVTLVSLLLFDWLSVKMGMAMKGLVAFGSVGTLAFTLASQGLVTQLLSGLLLSLTGKMYVGDTVKFGDGTTGKVAKLSWFETDFLSSDNTRIRVPNSMLANQKMSNLSRVKQCQVQQTLRFQYRDADIIPDLVEAIREEIKVSCMRLITDNSRPFRVFWTNYNEDHLEVVVNTHHNIAPLGDAYWMNRQNVLQAIHRAVKKFGIEFAELYMVPVGRESEFRVVPKRRYEKGIVESQDDDKGKKMDEKNGKVDGEGRV